MLTDRHTPRISWNLLIGGTVGTPIHRFRPSLLAPFLPMWLVRLPRWSVAFPICWLFRLVALSPSIPLSWPPVLAPSCRCGGAIVTLDFVAAIARPLSWLFPIGYFVGAVGWVVVLASLHREIWLADCFLLSDFDSLRPF
ncbi:hypothetical protein Nepgr_010496 [Nepenthes gracilis]|uniref:Uncharacterized protein n=1 Tax=Nepenthes gracilis TaxID=150966 RepID=A0AAD3XLG9_NEPGR|nr:hypothetical protein Nepgr_010496 [Nepenthes gracilis]